MEIEDVDLVINFRKLARILERTAADIATELHSPQRAHQLAGLLEMAANDLRARALAAPPQIIDPDPPEGLPVTDLDTPTADERLAAQLTALAAQLATVAPEVLGGRVDRAERHQLADTLIEVAHDVWPGSSDGPRLS